MHNNDTTTTTTRAEAPTLAEMLAARAEQIAANERENARRAQISRENDRREALDYISSWMLAHVSPELADALRMLPTVDDNRLDEDSDDYHAIALAGFLQLDPRGAGVDDGEDARRDPSRDERWMIVRTHRLYVGYSWELRGPHGYAASLGEVYNTEENLDAAILDALAAYTAWLARADERRAEEERKQQAKQQRAEHAKPRRYAYVEGINRDDKHPGILTRGNRLSIRVQNPCAENGLIEYTCVLDNFSVGWLLITTESDRQRLIPVVRVQDITPLADLAPDLDTEPNDAA